MFDRRQWMIFVSVAVLTLGGWHAYAQTGRYTRTAGSRTAAELLLPVLVDGKWGFINARGKTVIEPRFGTKGQFSDGLAAVTLDGEPGYVDAKGAFTPLPDYDELFPFADGMARVSLVMDDPRAGTGGKSLRFTFINTLLRPASRSYYDLAGDFREGLCRVVPFGGIKSRSDPMWGFIDRRGRVVIEPQWVEAGDFSEGKARVRVGQKWGYINGEGRIVIQPRFDAAGDFRERLAAVRIDGKLGYIDERGGTHIPPRFHYAGDFSSNRAIVTERFGQRFYFIKRDGERAFAGDFEAAGTFSEGLARVYRDRKWGYVDVDGKEVIPPQFEDAHDFRGGVALVAEKDAWGYVNPKGEFIWRSRQIP